MAEDEVTTDERRASRDATEGSKPAVPGAADPAERPAARAGAAKNAVKDDNKAHKFRDRFLKLSGYKLTDLIGENENTRTFVTSNGGKYSLIAGGKRIRVLAGPLTPLMLEEESEEEEEDE